MGSGQCRPLERVLLTYEPFSGQKKALTYDPLFNNQNETEINHSKGGTVMTREFFMIKIHKNGASLKFL